jgi:hypothetical protein
MVSQEKPALAERVTGPSADHEQDTHAEHVRRSQPLDQTLTAVELAGDGGAAMFVTVASITSRASASSTSPRIAHIRRPERRVVTVPGSVKVVMRNVLLGSVRAPLLGSLSPPLGTPPTRSDTAFEIFFQNVRREFVWHSRQH